VRHAVEIVRRHDDAIGSAANKIVEARAPLDVHVLGARVERGEQVGQVHAYLQGAQAGRVRRGNV